MYAVNFLKYDNKKKDFKQSSFSYVVSCVIGGASWLTLTLTDEKDDPTVYLKIILNEDFSVTAKMGKVDSKGKYPMTATSPEDAYNSNQALMVFEHFVSHKLPNNILDNTNCDYLAFYWIADLIVEKFTESFTTGQTLITRVDPLDKKAVLTAWSELPDYQHLSALREYAIDELESMEPKEEPKEEKTA